MRLAKLSLGVLAAATCLCGTAMAGEFSGYVTGVTDYRFRGISNSDRHPTVQASVNWAHEDGLYFGVWGSGVDFNDAGDTGIEIDIYGGKKFDLGDDMELNLEAYYYSYPDQNNALSDYNYFELIGGLSKSWDAFTLGGQIAYSPEFFGQTGTAWYVSANASYAINDWVSVSGNLGHQWIHLGASYTNWDLGATFTLDQFALDVRYVDTNLGNVPCGGTNWCDPTVVAALTFNIGGD